MKNRLTDLNNHLFAQLERLADESLTAQQIEQEVRRADAIVAVSEQVIRNAGVALKAVALIAEHDDQRLSMPSMLREPETLEGRAIADRAKR